MKRELSCILAINRYLIRCKHDSRRVELVRRYLKHKLDKMLRSKRTPPPTFFGIPIPMFT
jgi:hypothetical protein